MARKSSVLYSFQQHPYNWQFSFSQLDPVTYHISSRLRRPLAGLFPVHERGNTGETCSQSRYESNNARFQTFDFRHLWSGLPAGWRTNDCIIRGFPQLCSVSVPSSICRCVPVRPEPLVGFYFPFYIKVLL
jgi:hypothetical protein